MTEADKNEVQLAFEKGFMEGFAKGLEEGKKSQYNPQYPNYPLPCVDKGFFDGGAIYCNHQK